MVICTCWFNIRVRLISLTLIVLKMNKVEEAFYIMTQSYKTLHHPSKARFVGFTYVRQTIISIRMSLLLGELSWVSWGWLTNSKRCCAYAEQYRRWHDAHDKVSTRVLQKQRALCTPSSFSSREWMSVGQWRVLKKRILKESLWKLSVYIVVVVKST